ncbi:hypothetical protein [Halobacillus sp. Cin3]|uniref:hypothetical protein n=1 Tax=Halobacillus sp. Cin3 TaxID=2928441 RepID=UPI00248E4846|nr:hypothetical protein [Halobacillus sp. Cin3]
MEAVLTFTSLIAVIIAKVLKNKKRLAQLTAFQMIGVGATYVVSVFIGFILIYYGGNWIASKVPYKILSTLVFILIVIAALSVCVSLMNKTIYKITNGLLPREEHE